MRARNVVVGLVVVVILALSGRASAAQVPPGRQSRPADELSPVAVADMLDSYALVQAQDALQLNESQFGQFVTRLRKLQQMRRQSQRARNQILGELRRLVNPQAAASGQPAPAPDEAAIREKLKALRDHDERSAAELRRAYDALDEVMDARQQGRFRLFEEQLERRKLDLLMRARQGARRGGTGLQ